MEAVLAFTGIIVSATLAIAAYFIQRWIQTVDEALKQNASSVTEIKDDVTWIKASRVNQSKGIADIVRTELALLRQSTGASKLDKIEEDTNQIKNVIQDKILPELHAQRESFGAVKVLDARITAQETKLLKVFRAVEILADKKKPDRQ